MISHHRKLSVCAILAITIICCTAIASAQAPAKDSKDIREIAAYRLTTDGLTKYSNVLKAIDELSKKDPSFKEHDQENSDNGQKTIDETVQGYQRHPQLINAIKSAGFTPREFVVFSYALFANSAAMAYKQAGMKDMPPGASAANIEFVEKHQKELQALGNEKSKKPSQSNDETQ